MGSAPGFVLVGAVLVVIVAIVLIGRARRASERRAVLVLAEVLQGSVDDRDHAVGQYGAHRVDAHLSYADPTPVGHARDQLAHPVRQLHVKLRVPGAGGGAWSCRRSPALRPDEPGRVAFVDDLDGLLPGTVRLVGRFGIEPIDDDAERRLIEAGLLDEIEGLGRPSSDWLPLIVRVPRPSSGRTPFTATSVRRCGIAETASGVQYTCTIELAGEDVTAEQFRAHLDALLRVVAIDAEANN